MRIKFSLCLPFSQASRQISHNRKKNFQKIFFNGFPIGFNGMDLSDVRIGRLILFEHFYLPKITN